MQELWNNELTEAVVGSQLDMPDCDEPDEPAPLRPGAPAASNADEANRRAVGRGTARRRKSLKDM